MAAPRHQDLWAGLLLLATGVAALVFARGYPAGTVLRMGPGYFPTVLGGILVLFGLYVAIMGLRRGGAIPAGWSPRALVVVPLAMVLFGVLVEHAGFVPFGLQAAQKPRARVGEPLVIQIDGILRRQHHA